MFLEQSGSATAFGGIRRLLTEQIDRSSALEQKLLRALAVEREPMSVAELIASMGPRIRHAAVLEAVEALRRRSLVERAGTAAFTLQSVVLEYVTDRLVEDVGDEIARGQPLQLVEQPLIKAQTKEYLRQTQESLIGEPILQRLNAESGPAGAEQRLLALLDGWRNRPDAEQGYGPGNVVNLLRLGRGDLRNLDLAHLALRQAYLAGVESQDASLAGSHLAEAVLAEAFNVPSCVALSNDGAAVVAGMLGGEVWLWRVADRTPLLAVQGHSGPVHCVVLSADGRLLASGGEDGTVRLWEAPVISPGVASGGSPATPWSDARLLATLEGHTGAVRSVGLSADGGLLASGSYDGTIRLWEVRLATRRTDEQAARSTDSGGDAAAHPNVGRLLATLEGHAGPVYGVALSTDGRLLASGGWDGTIRLWETSNGRLLTTFDATTHPVAGHAEGVWVLALSTDGRLLASGGLDGTVRLWETDRGGLLSTFQAHAGPAYALALSADGRFLVSGSIDGAIRLWDARSAQPLATLQGHSSHIHSVALSGNAQLLASGSWDGTVRLWDVARSRPLATLQAQGGGIRNVALTADGQLLASGGQDGTIRLWQPRTGHLLATLQRHTSAVWGVALSMDGRLLASCALDGTVRLWDASTGVCRRILRSDRRYERLDITGLTGVTAAQRATLLTLGAVDHEAPAGDTAEPAA